MKNAIKQMLLRSSLTVIASVVIFISGECQTPASPVTPAGTATPPTSVPSLTPTTLPGQPAPLPGTTTPPGQTNPVNTVPNGSAPSVSPNPNAAYPNGGANNSNSVQFVPSQNYLQPTEPAQTSPVSPMDTSGNHPHQ